VAWRRTQKRFSAMACRSAIAIANDWTRPIQSFGAALRVQRSSVNGDFHCARVPLVSARMDFERRAMRAALVVVALLSACVAPLEAPRPPAGPSDSQTRQITAQGQFEVTVPRSVNLDVRHRCWAAAQLRNANWTGLWWTLHQAGEVTCALAPRRHNVVEAPSMESLPCAAMLCDQLPVSLATQGTRPAAIHEHPDDASRIIGEVSPGEQVTVFDRMYIQAFSHRGVVRRATNSLAVGDVVFPAPMGGDDPFPWRSRPPGPDETGYSVRTVPYGVMDFVPIDANEPYVEWTPLAPLRGNVSWVLLEDSEGVRGWAADSALGIDFLEIDENE
jgi:hypothetical protein